MERAFGADFGRVRVHDDRRASWLAGSISAEAFTLGEDVYFARGRFRPRETGGRELLAHELVHVIQQRRMAPFRTVRRRRVPADAGLAGILPGGGVDEAAHVAGLERIIARARAELVRRNPANWATVRQHARGPLTEAAFNALSRREQLLRLARGIRTVDPNLTLGDPTLINTGARNAADTANIQTLVTGANTIFAAIAAGTHDTWIDQVFGAGHRATAKTRYANARTRMNHLHGQDLILTDRSGYNAEVELGGLSGAQQITVAPGVIDSPADAGSVVTIIHESMHAGNPGVVGDRGYINRPEFTQMSANDKLRNAAHYEVVPRRRLNHAPTFTGRTFTPAGSGATPPLTARQEAIRAASERFRKAWTVGLNLHTLFVRVFRNPTEWATLDLGTAYGGVGAGVLFSQTLPFWSKVEMLTIHARAGITPAGPPAEHPVTLIDLSLSEGLLRKLSIGMTALRLSPQQAGQLETQHGTAVEIQATQAGSAAARIAAERDMLLRIVVDHRTGPLTGNVARDMRVLSQMEAVYLSYAQILAPRAPGAFP